MNKHYLLWFGKSSLWFSLQNTAGKKRISYTESQGLVLIWQATLPEVKNPMDAQLFTEYLVRHNPFYVDNVNVTGSFLRLQNNRAHEPLFCESNATALFQSKEQSRQIFTAGPFRISTWARHRLSIEHALDSGTLVSCLCPVMSATEFEFVRSSQTAQPRCTLYLIVNDNILCSNLNLINQANLKRVWDLLSVAAKASNIFVDFPSRARVSKKYVYMVCAENTANFSRSAYSELQQSKSSFGDREWWMRCFR